MKYKILILFFILFINSSSVSLVNSSIVDVSNITYCPPPLLFKNSSNYVEDTKRGYHFVSVNGTVVNCIQPCPSLYFDYKEEWQKMMNMALVVGTFSFFASVFLILTYSPLLNKNYRNRHTIGILAMFFGIFLIMLTDVWNLEKRFEVGCPEIGRYSRQSDPECGATGIIFQFGCVSAVISWTVLAFDLYFSIKKIQFKAFDKYYLVVIYAFSLILTFVPAIGKQYGYTEFALGCWILDFPYQISCFWLPLSLCLISSTVVVLMILFEVYKIIKVSNQKSSIKGHIKPLLCLICNCLEFFYMFGYSLFLKTQMEELEKGMDDYIYCLLDNATSTPGSFECKPKKLGMTAQFIFLISLRLLGVSGIAFFGFNSRVKKIWLDSIIFNNRFMRKYFSLSSSSNTPNFSGNRNNRFSIQYNSGNSNNNNNSNSINLNSNYCVETPEGDPYYNNSETPDGSNEPTTIELPVVNNDNQENNINTVNDSNNDNSNNNNNNNNQV
ncbi:hypothetical protein DICPUDRAFT_147382 [Dictyostelium purpureum]|uniref:G-protein coupled receptors family 2 profile 2 domain-containing protein n=1 Tax=Dictyostelium purpureum TaxID=5786 RepID=F0Z8D1_DICPU|nr:uncharacterized protein DICPUDRAFT_147382 [Dictyostelium purpureum]EGC39792.1 hypothetical protein DICPUDRAFT_147382 [Dictyostelium purpureum]|eukprot:XP_003283659.1 hypothetical protein DICPUDRAFT_147382 [Dictyostelium purpureum]